MSYYFSKTVSAPLDETVTQVRNALADQGFGVITDIDMAKTLRDKIDVEFRPYRILGACNPKLAYEALQVEDKVGTMLPCNVIVQEFAPGRCEVAAIDPVASMSAIDNPALQSAAQAVQQRLRLVIEAIG
ncbi:protein of unknown function DUF302 [Novosphingobium aromaticivorans DSM 12444]|uniref:DUF302 domain-containing protein n=1 Tax=Novosphingobium aromaticivorans (strain ATCC 700278 / DSM 12444 / CCUG 56034 / CIP 105152 / NBRC 16084 / F199) TaxID=279238 RepID=Q2GBC1_NOVAD|nr:DUF302 domain-containing protein [Novosphingobium aromaticivorans]ABD24852.1 protein of unknown function DUF302 [Novosphingobium aromaticivorans DSM 12444]SCY15608.1 Uncharacterized conserved protein, DUF302 family [Novosphingobium aromaticivorans]